HAILFDCHGVHPDLPSFPTRRSSDLENRVSEINSSVRLEGWGSHSHSPLLFKTDVPFDTHHKSSPRCLTSICSYPCERRLLSSVDRKSTRLNSSHVKISYAVFCLKKK